MPPERRRPPGECGLGVRLRVEARLEGSASRADCLELRAAGSPEECFARLEYATLAWFGAAVTCGFQLLVEAAGTSAALLTPSHLRDSFLWNHGHICVKVRPAIRLRGRSVFEHGRWIHAAASTIQRRWQLYRRWRQWVEAEDILCAFDLAVSRQGLRVWNPVPLAQADTSSPSLVADPKLLRLAVVLLTCMPCQSQPEKLFLQWAEQRSVFFVVQAAAEFTQCLSELAFDRWPGCRNVLGLLVRELLNKLGSAFPFMVEPAVEQHVEAVAAAAATAAKRRRGSCSSGDVLRRSFETGIQSAVLACVLQMASEAIWASATSFHDEELLWRIRDMPSYRQVLATVQQLQPGADNERLLLLRPAGLPHVVGEEVLLLPARRSENLGVALQASCLFYGVDYAKLCLDVAEEHTGFGEHALPVETIVGSIPAEGTFLTLWVQYESPEPGSFERALQDIVNAVGSRFSLDRQHCICKLEARWSSPEVTPEVPEMPLGLGDTLVLPEVYSGETQYFHFYDSVERRMTTVRCPLASIVKALREECALVHGEPLAQVPFAHLAKHVARPTSLLGSMRGLQRRLDHWLQAPFSGADVEPKNLDYRNCSAWLTPGFLPAQVAKATRGLAQVAPGIVGRGLRGGAPGDAARAGRAGRLRDGAAAGAAADAEEEQQRQKGFRDFFRCDVKGRLEKNGGPRVYHDFFSSEKKGQEKRPVAAKAASGTSASKLAKRPESVVPVMAAAAASSAPLVLFQPLTKWSLVEVQRLSAHQAVLPSQWGVSLPHGATLASGALAGATLGGMLGPIGSVVGAASGVAVSGGARTLLLALPQTVSLPNHNYVFEGPGRMYGVHDQKMYLMHENTLRPQIGLEGMVGAALVQASLRGIVNLKEYYDGSMSRTDLALSALRDCRDGAGIWALNNAVLNGLSVLGERSVGPVHALAALGLKYPAPVMLIVMGAGWAVLQCTRYSLSVIDREELRSEMVLSGSSTAAAVVTNVVLTAAGVPVLLHIPLTTFAARCAGVAAYEAWRTARRRELQQELRAVALDIMGLPPFFSKQRLLQRFRVLARMVHPDRNLSPDAKEMFQLFGLCRDVLLQESRGSAEALAHAGLARQLRRASWILTDWIPTRGPQCSPRAPRRAPHPVRAPPYNRRGL